MANVSAVTEHIERKLEQARDKDIKRKVLRFYHTADGSLLWIPSPGGDYWRVMNYIL